MSAAVARACVASPPLMSVIFSTPPASTTSCMPEATSMKAMRKARPPDAHADSTRVHGMLAWPR